MKYILTIDQGTTSCRTIIYDEDLNEIGKSQKEIIQIFPEAGWVEHDPEEIWNSQFFTIKEALEKSKISANDIVSIGITNQRETVIVWDKKTGRPIYNAIVWQDRRTADICESLKQEGHEKYITENTGLIIDAYFSATKIQWILDNVDGARTKAENGELLCGTIDCWLIWKLTGGRVHATDVSNASRTMLFNIRTLKWDTTLLDILKIPVSLLPVVKNSADDFGAAEINNTQIPIRGVAGDQQAALFGQNCFEKGDAKNTYGTGCFMLMNIGDTFISSQSKLLTTIAWGIDNKIEYAYEGSVFIAGAVIQWLRDELEIINSSEESEIMAASLKDNGGVYFIPAFTGLGAPHWDMYARGTITGLTRGTTKNHIVRAALESIAYQTRDVFDAMQNDSGIKLKELKVDGGASSNNWLMQFQADILQVPVNKPDYIESTARGAAMLAGIGIQLFTIKELKNKKVKSKKITPALPVSESETLFTNWLKEIRNIIHREK